MCCSGNYLSLWEQAVILGKGEATKGTHLCDRPPTPKGENREKRTAMEWRGRKKRDGEKQWLRGCKVNICSLQPTEEERRLPCFPQLNLRSTSQGWMKPLQCGFRGWGTVRLTSNNHQNTKNMHTHAVVQDKSWEMKLNKGYASMQCQN